MTDNERIIELAESIKSKEDFVYFLRELSEDFSRDPSDWENISIDRYLEAMAAWITDMDGYFQNMNIPKPEKIDWKFLGTIFLAATSYE